MLQHLVCVDHVKAAFLDTIKTLPVVNIADLKAHVRDTFLLRVLSRLLNDVGGRIDRVYEALRQARGKIDCYGAGTAAYVEDLEVRLKVRDQVWR
jgi:hypothetical protein